ncbi:MAG: DUF1189 family protein [Elusimicrobia bacterium]|nr:DUF1189 family protein [Elusimicrobiota bacterium]
MFPDLLDAVSRPAAYRRFSAEKAGRTASYVAFLSLIFVAAIGVAVKLRLAPLFTETFSWLETNMPTIDFAGGVVTATPPGPTRLEHPRTKDVALMVDTTRKDPVTSAQMTESKVLAYLTGNALYLDRGSGQVETIDLSKAASERPIKVDAGTYKGMEAAFDWIFYPALLLFFFLAFALSILVSGLVYALVGMLLASAARATLSYAQLLRLGIHAQTAGCALYALDALSPVAIPLLPLVSAGLSLTFLWLGVRAHGSADAPPPAPAA